MGKLYITPRTNLKREVVKSIQLAVIQVLQLSERENLSKWQLF